MADKGAYILLSLYESLYFSKYNRKPRINKYKEKWGMQDVIDSVGFERAKEILEYYFNTGKVGHQLQFFYYNFDRMDDMMNQLEQDRENRARIIEQTKRLVQGEE